MASGDPNTAARATARAVEEGSIAIGRNGAVHRQVAADAKEDVAAALAEAGVGSRQSTATTPIDGLRGRAVTHSARGAGGTGATSAAVSAATAGGVCHCSTSRTRIFGVVALGVGKDRSIGFDASIAQHGNLEIGLRA